MSNKPSWRKLLDLGVVKRTDQGLWARPSAIRIVPGFNLRDPSTLEYQAAQAALDAHMRRGGKVPALEVNLSKDGQGVDVVEGHRRKGIYDAMIAEGAKIEWIRIDPFEGNDKERYGRVLSSQENMKLLPMELAEGYARMKTLFGMTNEEIGLIAGGKSRQHIESYLLLAHAPHAVQQMVRSGKVSPTTAIESVREHGDGAALVLGGAAREVTASGKKKVTTAALRPWTPPARAVLPMMTAIGAVVDAIPEHVRQTMIDKPSDGSTIELPAAVVYELLAQQGAIQALRDKAQKKAAGKPATTDGESHAD